MKLFNNQTYLSMNIQVTLWKYNKIKKGSINNKIMRNNKKVLYENSNKYF